MALGTVHYVEPGPGGSEVSTRVILQQDVSDHLRNVVDHFPIADAVDNLALHEPCAEGIQSVQLTLVYSRSGSVAAREIKRVGKDDAERGAEGGNHVQPGQMGRRTQVLQGTQDGVS
jgi:hypothetical protein